MKRLLNIIFALFLASNLWAQSNCTCCDENHGQFDFWVGNWTVVDTLGNKMGENRITKRDKNCVLLEQWTGTKGSTGTSINYWDKSDSTWNQLWVDNNGGILKLKGRLEEGSMVMKSDLIPGKNAVQNYNQIKWTPNENGTVTQEWEVFDKDGNSLQVIFKGIYQRFQETDEGG